MIPSPEKPDLHAHTWEPTVLVHTAFTSQLSVLVVHSFISEGKKKSGLIKVQPCYRGAIVFKSFGSLAFQFVG